jgi:hypothetical protein
LGGKCKAFNDGGVTGNEECLRKDHFTAAGVAIARESKYIHLAWFVFDLLAL